MKNGIIWQGFGPEGTKPSMLAAYNSIGLKAHNGIDFSFIPDGEPVCFNGSGRGKVLATSVDNNGGLGVDVLVEDEDGIFKIRYWHLKEFKCKPGDIVESGNLLGLADNTGWSTGTHLHYEMKEMVLENGIYKNKYDGNGYYGAIDPMPYSDFSLFIGDVVNNLTAQLSILQKILEIMKALLGLK